MVTHRGLTPSHEVGGNSAANRGRVQRDGLDVDVEGEGRRHLEGCNVILEGDVIELAMVEDALDSMRESAEFAVQRSYHDHRIGRGATPDALSDREGPPLVGHPAAAKVPVELGPDGRHIRELARSGGLTAQDASLPEARLEAFGDPHWDA